jgi:O-antigen ligase
MSSKKILTYIFPLFLISPMLNLVGFGLTLAEIATLILAVSFMVTRGSSFRLPVIMYVFILLVILGRLGAFINSFNYNLPLDYTKLIFLFIILIQVSSFYLARLSGITIEEILVSKYAQTIVLILFFFALIYTVSDEGTRGKIMNPFWLETNLERLKQTRFPGLGINSNIYSFFVFIFFLFYVKLFFENKVKFLVPFYCFFIIVFCASKTTIGLSLLAFLVIPLHNLLSPKNSFKELAKRKSLLILTFISILIIIGIIGYTNESISDYIIVLRRLNSIIDNSNSTEDRFELWNLGMERVQLSPFLGIDVVQTSMVSDTIPLYFANPHNEFIFYWMSLGILGMLAYFLIVAYFLIKNLFVKFKFEWCFIFFSLLVQMTFDGAFAYLRFQFFYFLLIALNLNEFDKYSTSNAK